MAKKKQRKAKARKAKQKKARKSSKKPLRKTAPRQRKESRTIIKAEIPTAKVMDREQRVSKIEEGTVIDHITPDTVFKVVEVLKLASHPDLVSIATNLPSKKMGKKALIKIEKRFLTEEEVNKISVFAPDATVSIIKRFEVKEKGRVQVPEAIDNVIKCSNPSCITNHEHVITKFVVVEKDPLRVLCRYCERPMVQSEIQIV
jgi:aspartate carbamoyltransferase regulatory subunit